MTRTKKTIVAKHKANKIETKIAATLQFENGRPKIRKEKIDHIRWQVLDNPEDTPAWIVELRKNFSMAEWAELLQISN